MQPNMEIFFSKKQFFAKVVLEISEGMVNKFGK